MLREPRLGMVHAYQMRQRRSCLFAPCVAVATMVLIVVIPQCVLAALSFSGDVMLNTGQTTAPALIGRESLGSLQLDNGSAFSSGQTQFGVNPTGIGFGTVAGPGSRWTMGTADVGYNGIGTLNIQNGGFVDVTSGLRIGTNPSGNGTVAVTGAGSTLLSRTTTNVGGPNGGIGSLEIGEGAIVNATQSILSIGPQGRILLDGGLLRIATLNNGGQIGGSGEVSILQSGTNISQGRLFAGDGDLLRITGAQQGMLTNNGLIEAHGGEIEIWRLVNSAPRSPTMNAEITLRNGTVRISSFSTSTPQLTNFALLASLEGENHFYGTIMNSSQGSTFRGEIAVTNESRMIFHDDVTIQSGMMTVFPGSKATLLEDLALASGSLLLADIAGSDIDTDYGEIEVVGNVSLGGALQVVLSDGFTPSAGDSFQILKSYGGIEGSLSLDAMPALPNRLVWDLNVTPNQMLLNVLPAPAGDYNLDGVVDTADYVTWRRSAGQSGDGLAADGNRDGTVDDADYALWSANFGATAGGDSGGVAAVGTAVPEPAACSFVGIALVAVIRWRIRRWSENR